MTRPWQLQECLTTSEKHGILLRKRNIRNRSLGVGMDGQDEAFFLETIQTFLTVYRYLRQYSRQLHSEGFSGRKIATLRYLLETEPLTIGQLRDYLYISDSTTSELVAKLEDAGCVERVRSEEDNRVVLVSLTPSGRESARNAPLGGIPLLRERLKSLPPERIALIHKALIEIKQMLEIDDEQ
jgi:MarR family transcriptional regulator, organic hydroperoxide resistance regulator